MCANKGYLAGYFGLRDNFFFLLPNKATHCQLINDHNHNSDDNEHKVNSKVNKKYLYPQANFFHSLINHNSLRQQAQ
jgi:hypothetical protein